MQKIICLVLSQHYGYKGLNTCIYASCATSLFSIDYAMRYVDDYDYMICVISEHGVNEADISFNKQIGEQNQWEQNHVLLMMIEMVL